MKWYVKLLLGSVIGLLLLAIIGVLTLRESLGGQVRFDYKGPTHPEYRVEIYEQAGFGGDPTFSLFVVGTGIRKYFGDFSANVNSVWTDNLGWSKDGIVVFCRDHDYRAAYVFGQRKLFNRNESRGASEISSLLAEHGGQGESFFDFKFDPATSVWRDFVPSENN